MAGYVLYSLDWPKFQQLVAAPTREQTLLLAGGVVETVEEVCNDYENENDNEARRWPRDRAALADVLAERLTRPEWYADLTDPGKLIWDQGVIGELSRDELALGFDVPSDGVYWSVIELARGEVRAEAAPGGRCRYSRTGRRKPDVEELDAFGERAFRYGAYRRQGRVNSDAVWYPTYSFHTPEQVQKLLQEVEAAEPDFRDLPDADTREQFYDFLLEPLKEVAAAGRLLWIHVDT